MPIARLLQTAQRLEIQEYRRPRNVEDLKKTHVPFTGAPYQHPHDAKRVLLIADPYSTNTFYYEFRASDISFVEELPSIGSIEGKVITMVRIWVKKQSVGVRCTPFVVEDLW